MGVAATAVSRRAVGGSRGAGTRDSSDTPSGGAAAGWTHATDTYCSREEYGDERTSSRAREVNITATNKIAAGGEPGFHCSRDGLSVDPAAGGTCR